jgi:hypothetical protein
MEYQKTLNFEPISNSLLPAFKNAPKKLLAKKHEKCTKKKYPILAFFSGYNFLGEFFTVCLITGEVQFDHL